MTLSSKLHLVENRFQIELHSNAISTGVAKAVFSFASGIKPIQLYPDLRSREEEKILLFHNLASKSVTFGRGQYQITLFHLCAALMYYFSNQ